MIKAQADDSIQTLFDGIEKSQLPNYLEKSYRLAAMRLRVEELEHIFNQMVASVLRYLLPEGITMSIVEFIPDSNSKRPFLTRLDIDSFRYDKVQSKLEKAINNNPQGLRSSRIQELKAVKQAAMYSRFPLLVVCAETIILRDAKGKHVAEWDGLILEVSEECTCLNIIEAKDKKTPHQNEREAFAQLANSRSIIRKRHKTLKTQRTRISKLGAKLKIFL